jgi:hypothetical protein
MRILETPAFARRIAALLTESEHWALQEFVAAMPLTGRLIPGGHGLRKLRWRTKGRGKRGGLRVIYYYRVKDYIFFVAAYSKTEREDLSATQLRALVQLIGE